MIEANEKRVGLFISSGPDETRIHAQPGGLPAGRSTPLPLRLLLVSDLSPQAGQRDWNGASRIARVDKNGFAAFMAQTAPSLVLEVPSRISPEPCSLDVELTFAALKDFDPDRVARQVPVLASLIDMRALMEQVVAGTLDLETFKSRLDGMGIGRSRAEQFVDVLSRQAPAGERPPKPRPVPRAAASQDTLDRLLGMVDLGREEEPADPPQPAQAGGLFEALLGAAAGTGQPARQRPQGGAALALQEMDDLIAAQLTEILHHPAFRRLEAAWRGLKFVVDRLDFRSGVVLDVLPARRIDLSEALYYQVLLPEHGREHQEPPLQAVILDFSFDNSQGDVALLEDLAETGASLQTPIAASVASRFFGLETARGLSRIPVLRQHLEGPDYIAWNKLRDSENARFLALVAPPLVLRARHGTTAAATSMHVSEREPLWGGGALALAPVIASSFVKTGWPGRISGDQDGRLEDLPVWTSDTGHVPLAAVLSGEKQTELAEAGFVVLSCEPDRDTLCVTYAPTVRRVGRYANEAERTEALAHASLASQLFVARAAQLLLAYQEELQPGAVLSDVQSDLAGRLRALMRTTSEDSVQVDPVQGAPGRRVLAVRLRPPFGILPQPVSLVMGLQLPAEPDERAV